MTTPRLQDAFPAWAPEESRWSAWAKPVMFSYPLPAQRTPLPVWDETSLQAVQPTGGDAVVVDLPGVESLACGLALARRGFRPIPLFNTTMGEGQELIDIDPILAGLLEGAGVLGGLHLHAEAPPAFLLDSQRLKGTAAPTMFDNRWMVFPQDLPSARMLRAAEIRSVTLVRRGSSMEHDLGGVLRLWRRDGLEMRALDVATGAAQPLAIELSAMLFFLEHIRRLITGLRKNSSGGFGGTVPVPQATSGGYA